MLSRVADSLYWMSRYLERAEHIARLIDVNLHQMLDQSPGAAEQRWERLYASLRLAYQGGGAHDAYSLTRQLTFDHSYKASILACIIAARENAQQVREQISSEMWNQLNRLYLYVRHMSKSRNWRTQPHEFFQMVKEGSHLFQGITDSTMSHNEGWKFIQVGRFIERASATATIIDVHFHTPATLDYLTWIDLLKSCTAFEAYCKVYTADIKPRCIAEFLLLNPAFPHSIRFSIERLQTELQSIAHITGHRTAGRAERLTGRLQASLDYGVVDEILADNFHAYLENIQYQCGQIHAAIQELYISYPIETALEQPAAPAITV